MAVEVAAVAVDAIQQCCRSVHNETCGRSSGVGSGGAAVADFLAPAGVATFTAVVVLAAVAKEAEAVEAAPAAETSQWMRQQRLRQQTWRGMRR